MKEIKVMLVCGGGASSGFLAQSMRRSAEAKGVIMDVFARSESDVENYKNDIDVLLVGPHLKYLLPDIEKRLESTNAHAEIVDDMVYATLNGDKAVERVLEILKEKKDE